MSKKSSHVVPNVNGGWSVKKEHSSKAIKRFDNQQDAIKYAKEISKNEKGELIIHSRDGRIRQKDSYDSGSNPPRNKGPRKK
jgi:hypothetical protein